MKRESYLTRSKLAMALFAAVLLTSSSILSGCADIVAGYGEDELTPAQQENGLPDLTIRQYDFDRSNDKVLRILVANSGQTASKSCRMQLTVRKINGTPVGRTMYQSIPAIRPGESARILLDTTKILPKNVRLEDTTFKMIADGTNNIAESNEDNNETWHNL